MCCVNSAQFIYHTSTGKLYFSGDNAVTSIAIEQKASYYYCISPRVLRVSAEHFMRAPRISVGAHKYTRCRRGYINLRQNLPTAIVFYNLIAVFFLYIAKHERWLIKIKPATKRVYTFICPSLFHWFISFVLCRFASSISITIFFLHSYYLFDNMFS